MSSIGGGGENGGSAKDPTRPKPSSGDELAVAEADRQLALVTSEAAGDSNWDGVAADVRNTGPEGLLEGDVDLEDEFCMEEEAEEVVVPERPKVWKMLARYYSLSAANYSAIQKHFREVWRIRSKMIFTPLKNNFFIITFTSEGDFNFVDRGGPWIHQGVACLIAPFVNNAKPSETVLNTVRLWVRFYDVPWNKQTKEYGELIGGNFGKVVEVDVDVEGVNLNEYLCVRIDWPLNQRLLARFRASIKG
jgi:hypothetical protein